MGIMLEGLRNTLLKLGFELEVCLVHSLLLHDEWTVSSDV